MASRFRLTLDGDETTGNSKSAMRVALLLSFLVLMTMALASACATGMMGSGTHGQMHYQMHGGGSKSPQTPVVSGASEVTVEIANLDFSPRDLTVQAGSTVTWVNGDAVPHDATDAAGTWGTGTLAQGDGATLKFDDPGAFEYVCTIHPTMTATLTVV